VLPLFKKYSIFAALAFTAMYVIFLIVWWLAFSDNPYFFLMMFGAAFFFAFAALVLKKYFNGKALKRYQDTVKLLEQECNPAAFVEAAEPLTRNVKPPFDTTASWFMSYYARGLYEAGHEQQAANLLEALRQNVNNATNPHVRAVHIINMVPSIRSMVGGHYALEALREAEALIKEAGVADNSPRQAYALWELANLEAQQNGQLQLLAERMHEAAAYERNTWLARVECAEREALVYQTCNMTEAETVTLQFVAEHGGSLTCAARAKQRLAELSAQPACLTQPAPAMPAPAPAVPGPATPETV